ncbi:MAG TPA: hypothetical protein VEK07_10265 [Polyangiaceae bacterium]|nr:hypothetical protein [Polyangiaceae bacterium]
MLAPTALATVDDVARVAIVEGYNSNTYQAQDDPNLPVIERHPSPFTGVDADVELRFLGRDTDLTTINVEGRVDHYEPLQKENQSDDGAVNLALASTMALGPRTMLQLRNTTSAASFNAAHVTDGTIFAFDPTLVRSSYWLEDLSASIVQQLSRTWRLTQSVGGMASGTISSAPTQTASGELIEHRGLDYLMPYAETDLLKELSPRASGDLTLLYQYAYQLYVYDFTQTPPRYIGPDKQAFLTGLAGYAYHFSPEISAVARAGGVLSSAPPRDIDQRPILAPAALGEFYWTRPFFSLVATAGYAWGTVNPRLGEGPTASGSVLAIGTPRPIGAWKNLALVATGQFEYSQLITGVNESTKLGLYAAGVQVRYGLNRWLGLLAGFDGRYATFSTPGTYQPPFLQTVVFFGLSGYWSTDRAQFPLTTFAAPITPPT